MLLLLSGQTETRLHGATYLKKVIFKVTAIRTSNLTLREDLQTFRGASREQFAKQVSGQNTLEQMLHGKTKASERMGIFMLYEFRWST
jgi:hypothetical protein